MSWFSNLFSSPRERAGKDIYGQQAQGFDDIMKEADGLTSSYDDPTAIDKNQQLVNRLMAPRRAGLNTQLGRSRSAAVERMGGNNATPGVTFGNIESAYAPAFSDLESSGMDWLDKILGKRDTFNQNKIGLKTNVLGGKNVAQGNYLNSLSDASTFDDILGIGTEVGKYLLAGQLFKGAGAGAGAGAGDGG